MSLGWIMLGRNMAVGWRNLFEVGWMFVGVRSLGFYCNYSV